MKKPVITNLWFSIFLGAFLGHLLIGLCTWAFSVASPGYLEFALIFYLPVPVILGLFTRIMIAITAIDNKFMNILVFGIAFLVTFLALPGSAILDTAILHNPVSQDNLLFYRLYSMGLEIGSGIIVLGILSIPLYLIRSGRRNF